MKQVKLYNFQVRSRYTRQLKSRRDPIAYLHVLACATDAAIHYIFGARPHVRSALSAVDAPTLQHLSHFMLRYMPAQQVIFKVFETIKITLIHVPLRKVCFSRHDHIKHAYT